MGIPFGNFMANMLFSVLSSAGVIGPSTATIIIITEDIRQLTGRILGRRMNMVREGAIQSGQIRAFLSVTGQNKGYPIRVFPIKLIAVLVEAGVFLEEEEAALEALESNIF